MADKKPIVVMKGITIEFPGVKALDGVNLRLFPVRFTLLWERTAPANRR